MKKLQILKKGFLDVIPLSIPVIPFGIIYGVIAIEIGLSPLVAFCMSFIIFAGSSQIAFAQLFSAGASPLVMISSVAVINSRHFLYGAVLSQYLNKLNCYWKILLSYLMTDQAFIVSLSYFKNIYKKKDALFILFGLGLRAAPRPCPTQNPPREASGTNLGTWLKQWWLCFCHRQASAQGVPVPKLSAKNQKRTRPDNLFKVRSKQAR